MFPQHHKCCIYNQQFSCSTTNINFFLWPQNLIHLSARVHSDDASSVLRSGDWAPFVLRYIKINSSPLHIAWIQSVSGVQMMKSCDTQREVVQLWADSGSKGCSCMHVLSPAGGRWCIHSSSFSRNGLSSALTCQFLVLQHTKCICLRRLCKVLFK